MKYNILLLGAGRVFKRALNGLLNSKVNIYILKNHQDYDVLKSINTIHFVENIDDIEYDLIFTVGYGHILNKNFVKNNRIINLHPSLLPKYRGLHSVIWAMLNGDEFIGYSIHEVDELLDNGKIIYQYKTKVDNKTSNEIIFEFHNDLEKNIYDIINNYLSGNIYLIEQNFDEATFVARRKKEDCKIDWNWSIEYMNRVLKSLVEPYPLPYFVFKGNEYEVIEAKLIDKNYEEIPGHVVYVDKESVWIKMKDGLIRIYRLRSNGVDLLAKDLFKVPGYRL